MPISAETLKRYKKGSVFVETGCDRGEGIAAALEAGFETIISIELSLASVENARNRFRGQPVTVLWGGSAQTLTAVLNDLDEPATFWLDAHPDDSSPIIAELAVFAQYPLNTHTILVDDRRLMHGAWNNVREDDVRAALLRVNPLYKISTAPGIVADDVIVAEAE